MPVIKHDNMKLSPVEMDGVKGVTRAVVLGPPEGWSDHVMRVFRLEPGGFTPKHQHDWEHINHIISGRGKLMIGDQENELTEKDFALVPANTLHQFTNPYDEPFEFICIVPKRGEY